MSQRLDGMTAVITGANSGIGFASAERFIQEGADVIITGRRADAVEEAAQRLGPKARGLVGDAGKLSDISRLTAEIGAITPHVDVLFLNAGIAPMGPFEDVDERTFDQVFDINVKGPFFTVQSLLPLLKDGSSVFINASVVSAKGLAGSSAYSASKGAIRTLVRVLASELAPKGIRVNALSPGPVESPLWAKTGAEQEATEQMGEAIASMVPMGRFGKVEEMAALAAFLASGDSSYVNGADLHADGGFAQV